MQLPRPVRTILFDVGNTLAFLDPVRLARILQESGVFLPLEAVRAAESRARRRLYMDAGLNGTGTDASRWTAYMKDLLEEAGVDPSRQPGIGRRIHEAHRAENLWRFVPERTHETLQDLIQRGVRLGVVSNADGRVAALLEELELAPYFEVIVDSKIVGFEKPDPRIFDVALRAMHVESASAIYVGDFPAIDVQGARAAGVWPVLLDPLRLSSNPGCLVIAQLAELSGVLD